MVQVATLFCGERSDAREDATVDREQGAATLELALRSDDLLKISLVTTAAMLAICLLTLVQTTDAAEAKDSLPDNGKIAFSSSPADEIYTIEPDGSNLRRLTNSRSYTYNTRPIWSPDGKDIIFNYQGSAGELGLKIMRADGSNLRRLSLFKAYGTLVPSDVTWSPDGTKLAFGGGDILMMGLDGSNRINLTKTPELTESSPAFSPDGSQLCFSRSKSTQQPVPPDIYAMGIDGSDPTLLVEGDSQELSTTGIPSEGCDWSPDGTKIAFHASIPGPNEGDLRKALEKAIAEADSKKILGEGDSKLLEKHRELLVELDEEVYVINADGTGRTALTDNSASDLNVDWSPDGTKITFVSNRDGGDYDIYTMDADGSDVAQVTTNSAVDDVNSDWQPLPRPTPPKSRSEPVHPPDTGGPSLILVASALLCSGGVMFYAALKRSL